MGRAGRPIEDEYHMDYVLDHVSVHDRDSFSLLSVSIILSSRDCSVAQGPPINGAGELQ